MIARALRDGVRSATRRPGLVVLLWAWNLALALLVTLPFWRWISGASAILPETDALLDGLDIGIVTHLVQADPAVVPALVTGVLTLATISLLSGAFLSGGILAVVMAGDDGQALLHRFFAGAGRFFGRFLGLLAIAGISGGIVVGIVAALLVGATRPLVNGGSEPAAFLGGVIVQAGIALAVAFFILAHDYARAITVIAGTRSMWRTWLHAIGFVVRHSFSVAVIGLLAALGVLAALGASAAFDSAYGARAWSVIVAAIVLQQATALVRTAVRVGQVSTQASYCGAVLPRLEPVVVPVVAPVVVPVVADGPSETE